MRAPAVIRSQIFGALILLALTCWSSKEATAQVAAQKNNGAAAPVALPANSRPYQKPMYVQGAVVLVLMGGAVFAVVRSSSRV